MEEILQTALSFAPWTDPRTRRLPGIVPWEMTDWLEVDSAYAAQMALRERLFAQSLDEVHALAPQAAPAARELLDLVLGLLPSLGFQIDASGILCPDGRHVVPDPAQPLLTLGRLLQEDMCLLQSDPESGEHVLTGAVLCFPSGWRLREKYLRPMMRIHKPIEIYTADLGARVQRLMDGVQPGRVLVRGTASRSDAALADPRSEYEYRHGSVASKYIRVERQGLLRLPESGAVAFSIHTQIVRPDALSPEQSATLAEFPIRIAD